MEEKQTPEEKKPWRTRRSFFFPILLVVIGGIFLLQNLEIVSGDAWDTIWKLWPLLLIIIGIDNLLQGEGVAGPVFFAGLGVIFLLGNFDLLPWDFWGLVLRLWPVMLIAWGLDLVIGRRSIWGALLALVLILAIMGGALALVGFSRPAVSDTISWQPDEAVTSLRAYLDQPVGAMHVAASTDLKGLLAGELQLWQGESLSKEASVNDGIGSYRLSAHGVSVYSPMINSGPVWDMRFKAQMPLDLRVNMGAGEINLDLRDTDLANLKVDLGVGRVEITLPASNFSAAIDTAVGQTVIILPRDVSVQLVVDTGLAVRSIPSNFNRSDDVYTLSAGADAPKIELRLDQAIGSLVVRFGK